VSAAPHLIARRSVLAAAGAWVFAQPASAQLVGELASAVSDFSRAQPVQRGRVKLEIAPLVDNGNVVPVAVTVESAMSGADRVESIALFNEKNPQREVAFFTLGPRCARASVATRMRLATSQKVVAVARMADGSHWMDVADVVVVLAACIEGEGS